MVVDMTGDSLSPLDVDPDDVVDIVTDGDNEKAAELLDDPVSDDDEDDDDEGEVEVERLNCEDDDGIDVPVAVEDTEKSAETVAVVDNKGEALSVAFEVIDNIADCEGFSEVKAVALVVIEFVSSLEREKVDFGLFIGTLVKVKLLVGETLDEMLDES